MDIELLMLIHECSLHIAHCRTHWRGRTDSDADHSAEREWSFGVGIGTRSQRLTADGKFTSGEVAGRRADRLRTPRPPAALPIEERGRCVGRRGPGRTGT